MIIKYDVRGNNRKRLAVALAKVLSGNSIYMGAPTFAYVIQDYEIDRTGAVICPPGTTKSTVDYITECMIDEGFFPKAILGDRLSIHIPKKILTPDTLLRLRQVICNKASLFEKAFKTNVISLEEDDDQISFPWFTVYGLEGEAKAYSDFVTALCQMAKNKKRVLNKPYEGDNDKFAMRLFLVQLGLKGEEYKQSRKFLLRYLTGNSAWRNGVPVRDEK